MIFDGGKMMLKAIWILLMAGVVNGQIKIGDIEISDAIAKEYFLDLYAKPDTIPYRYLVINKEPYRSGEEIWSERKKKVQKTIYKCSDWKELGYSSKKEFIWLIKGKDGPGRSERIFYILPREPSASDFAKWFRKRD